MKKALTIALLLACMIGYGQDMDLPENVKSAFQVKYANTKIADWWIEHELYYLDFTVKGNSYTAVYNMEGTWMETSEIISDFEIPQSMNDFIKKTFPAAKISYGEKVEKPVNQRFIRVNIIDSGNVLRVICCDREGKNIIVQDTPS